TPAAIRNLGFYLGFLLLELGRRDWKNVILILTVGVVNGLGGPYARIGSGQPGSGPMPISISGVAGSPPVGSASASLMGWPITWSTAECPTTRRRSNGNAWPLAEST